VQGGHAWMVVKRKNPFRACLHAFNLSLKY